MDVSDNNSYLQVYRVIFHNPIADKLIPTFFILFAPPVIGFISLTKFVGVTPFGNMLYYFGLFLFVLMLFQLKIFLQINFYLSWWAYSLPMSALAIGTFLMYHETGLGFFKIVSWFIFVLLNFLILLLFMKTVYVVKNKRICIEEYE